MSYNIVTTVRFPKQNAYVTKVLGTETEKRRATKLAKELGGTVVPA